MAGTFMIIVVLAMFFWSTSQQIQIHKKNGGQTNKGDNRVTKQEEAMISRKNQNVLKVRNQILITIMIENPRRHPLSLKRGYIYPIIEAKLRKKVKIK